MWSGVKCVCFSVILPSMIVRYLQVLSVRQEVRNYSVTFRQRINDQPNSLAKSLLQRPDYNRRLKRYYPANLANRSIWYSVTSPDSIPNHLWLGCTSYMPLIVTVNTVVECLRTDCNILGDKIKKEESLQQTWQQNNTNANRRRNFDIFWHHRN
jgi:hypothetical protein